MQGLDSPKVAPRSEWASLGACSVESGPFMEDGNTEKCKEICSHCPVLDMCLEYALANNEKHNVWGGLTPKERQALLKIRRPNPHVPLEYREHWKELEGRIQPKVQESIIPPRNPALDYVVEADFLNLLSGLDAA